MCERWPHPSHPCQQQRKRENLIRIIRLIFRKYSFSKKIIYAFSQTPPMLYLRAQAMTQHLNLSTLQCFSPLSSPFPYSLK